MAASDYHETRRGGGAWFYVPVVLILFLGGALTLGAYFYADTQLTIMEALTVGFGGLAAIIFGMIVAVAGLVIGLLGALIGIVAAGGAIAMTLFLVASPIIAIILIVMLMRRSKSCPDPAMHE
ncbi:hypothetical protein MNBD_ALPHA05-725 [hydrothermal vent metagenome]|uniref:Uncharacterized protein n=1 Tax=hydrothermal vent metagenome TaxID=652676 RepID=A0A3B0SWF0_9ZZZZ